MIHNNTRQNALNNWKNNELRNKLNNYKKLDFVFYNNLIRHNVTLSQLWFHASTYFTVGKDHNLPYHYILLFTKMIWQYLNVMQYCTQQAYNTAVIKFNF